MIDMVSMVYADYLSLNYILKKTNQSKIEKICLKLKK